MTANLISSSTTSLPTYNPSPTINEDPIQQQQSNQFYTKGLSNDEESNETKQTEFDILQALSKYNIIGGLWVFTWFSLNITIAFGNKIVYWQGFSFPTILSLFHMLASWLLAFISLRYQNRNDASAEVGIKAEAKKHMWLYIVVFILNIVYGNIGIFRTSLHMSQVSS